MSPGLWTAEERGDWIESQLYVDLTAYTLLGGLLLKGKKSLCHAPQRLKTLLPKSTLGTTPDLWIIGTFTSKYRGGGSKDKAKGLENHPYSIVSG